MSNDFKVIKVDRFDSKAIRHAYDDVGRQSYNNRVYTYIHTVCNILIQAYRPRVSSIG